MIPDSFIMKAPLPISDRSETLIRVENASKKFCLSLKKSLLYGVQDMGRELMGRRHGGHGGLRPKEFWAVHNVSFELRRGECMGLIGRNGAGKTTLLKMLNGLIKPDAGRIEMRGRVGALIALGAGFNPILTGRENIYVNASVLGLSRREIDAKLEEIIDFAEIGEFIDTPVQSYSSGMAVRLGFAIASTLEPDVLLLDEVLAVGDAAFRNKCYNRIADIRKSAAVIFVSHSMEQVSRICNAGLVLANGKTISQGDIESSVRCYERLNEDGRSDGAFLSVRNPIRRFSAALGSGELQTGRPLKVILDIDSTTTIKDFMFRIIFYNSAGAASADYSCRGCECGVCLQCGSNQWGLEIESVPLKNGIYHVAFNLVDSTSEILVWSYKMHILKISGASLNAMADCQLQLKEWIISGRNIL